MFTIKFGLGEYQKGISLSGGISMSKIYSSTFLNYSHKQKDRKISSNITKENQKRKKLFVLAFSYNQNKISKNIITRDGNLP